MKGSCFLANTHKLYSPLPLSNANNHVVSCQNRFTFKVRNLDIIMDTSLWSNHTSYVAHKQKGNNSFVVGCTSWSLVRELEKELEAEMKTQEGEESGMARFRHKCEGKGVVEMLECLEREAIMGEDVGKEPMDYNRRAQIFDKSSKMFQALKELNNNG